MIRLGVVGLAIAVTASSASAASPGVNGRIAFVRITEYRAYTDDPGSIWTVAADGSGARRLTMSRWGDSSPAWSPDGRRIAFVRAAAPEDITGFKDWHEVFVMSADGRNVRRLTRNDVYDGEPTWSPDGKRIAFVRGMMRRERGVRPNVDVWIMRADGTRKRPLTRTPLVESSPAWAPRTGRVAYLVQRPELRYDQFGVEYWSVPEHRELWTMRGDGSRRGATGITSASFRLDLPWQTTEHLAAPDWSPDGRRLVVSTARGLVSLMPDGSDVQLHIEGEAPHWSPDGREIAFARYAEPDGFIYTFSPADRTVRRVTTNPFTRESVMNVFDREPAWQPLRRR